MKLKLFLTAVILGAGAFASAQGTFVYDQQSIGAVDGASSLDRTPFGQSFTPTFNSIGFVDLQLFAAGSVTVGINIRSGSITGPILGTSLPSTIPGNTSGIFDFLFSNPVLVIPGTQYYFEPVADNNAAEADITTIQYPGGDSIINGVPVTSGDLWFREGIVSVPEPSLAALFIVAGLLFWKQRKRVT